MNRLILPALLVAALTACGAAPSSPTGGRPELPSGVEVRFPAAPAGAPVYLNLMTETGESVYQKAVPTGATSVGVDSAAWTGKTSLLGLARPLDSWLPEGAVTAPIVAPDTPLLFLHWLMWQDKNSNGTREDGETLSLMTHDRVVYAQQAVGVNFATAEPDMQQHWEFRAGWGRAQHYVYLPLNSATYRRQLESAGLERYTLHVPTPLTSQ